jgi:hypothetical protein
MLFLLIVNQNFEFPRSFPFLKLLSEVLDETDVALLEDRISNGSRAGNLCIPFVLFCAFIIYIIEETEKDELVPLAASSIVSGVILFACLRVYYVIRKGFSRMANQLPVTEELSKSNEVQ